MRIKHHYYKYAKRRLLEFLDSNKIAYILDCGQDKNSAMCSFDLYEDSVAFSRFRWLFPVFMGYWSFASVEYSDEEIEAAEWLLIRSISKKVSWEFEEEAFHYTCPYRNIFTRGMEYRHMSQVGLLTTNRKIKWGKRSFFSGPDSADELLFCSQMAKQILGEWNGLKYLPVKKKNTSTFAPDLFQLSFEKILPIDALGGGKKYTCPHCGKQIIRYPKGLTSLTIRKSELKDPFSVYSTGNIVCGDRVGYDTYSAYIVSHEFYRLCKERCIDRGLVFEPIKVI